MPVSNRDADLREARRAELADARPEVGPGRRERGRPDQLGRAPPYPIDGFENNAGRARENYDVPVSLRAAGRGRALSAFGVYAFWSYVNASGDGAAAKNHWPAIKQRVQPLLDGG